MRYTHLEITQEHRLHKDWYNSIFTQCS